jgi:hypothetical protein
MECSSGTLPGFHPGLVSSSLATISSSNPSWSSRINTSSLKRLNELNMIFFFVNLVFQNSKEEAGIENEIAVICPVPLFPLNPSSFHGKNVRIVSGFPVASP